MDFYTSYDLEASSYEDIVMKLKMLKKYDKVIIVNDDPDYTTAVINLNSSYKNIFTKKDFTFHLPKYRKVKNNIENKTCPICQDKFENNEFYRKLDQCGHTFHKKCVDEWFFKSKCYSCPLCRNEPYCRIGS